MTPKEIETVINANAKDIATLLTAQKNLTATIQETNMKIERFQKSLDEFPKNVIQELALKPPPQIIETTKYAIPQKPINDLQVSLNNVLKELENTDSRKIVIHKHILEGLKWIYISAGISFIAVLLYVIAFHEMSIHKELGSKYQFVEKTNPVLAHYIDSVYFINPKLLWYYDTVGNKEHVETIHQKQPSKNSINH